MKLTILLTLATMLGGCEKRDEMICGEPVSSLPSGPDFVVENATIIDGLGGPRYVADVRISGGLIAEIGSICASHEDAVYNGSGLVLTPGFIDTHSHHDMDPEELKAVGAVSQGITTIVVGVDGGSGKPLKERIADFAINPYPVNVASFTGHNTLRSRVMGSDFQREATTAELDSMAELLQADMELGSLGLSTGLEYDPGIYSSTEEIVTLAAIAENSGGRYASHIRSEDRSLIPAIDEFLYIARKSGIPSHLSHIKIATLDRWGEAGSIIAKLDSARASGLEITADVYPYNEWQATLTVLLPERDFTDVEAAQYALDHLAPADGLVLGMYKPDPALVGKSIAEISNLWELGEAETYLKLINDAYPVPPRPGERNESVIGRSMSDADIAEFVQWEHSNITSDGASVGGHPRGFGAFTRAIRLYTREQKLMSLESMIHKMTSKAADNVGIEERGRIEVGAPADIVLLSEHNVSDKATMGLPTTPSSGIKGVWVNGVSVWDGGATTNAHPGEFIVRHE